MIKESIVFAGAEVLSSTTGWEPQQLNVAVSGGKIVDVRKRLDGFRKESRIIDASGLYIMPGLIDLHCHLTFRRTIGPIWQMMADGDALNTIRAVRNTLTVLRQGVMTIRELGAPNNVNTEVSKAVTRGLLPGPRILSAGSPLGVTGSHAKSIAECLDGPEEFRRATRRRIASGASWIKLVGSNDPTHVPHTGSEWSHGEVDADEIRATVETAHKWGARVSVHTMGSTQLIMVANGGVDTIEHGVYLNEEGANAMVTNNVSLVPTLSGYLETIWPIWERGENWIAEHTHLVNPHREAFRCALAGGVRIGVGTDSAGEIVHELQLLEEYGLSRSLCLEAVTRTNAEILGVQDLVGDIRSGLDADLLVLRTDPSESLDAIRDVEYVVQGGTVRHPLDIRLPSGDESGVSEPWFGAGIEPRE